MNTLSDPQARVMNTPDDHYFLDEQDAEEIYVWLSGVPEDASLERIEENAGDAATTTSSSGSDNGLVRRDGQDIRAVSSASCRYVVAPAEDSAFDEVSHAQRNSATIPQQDQSQLLLHPSTAPHEEGEHLNTLPALLTGWSRHQSTIPPSLPSIRTLFHEAQPLEPWQENWQPQSPRLLPRDRFQQAEQQQQHPYPPERRYRGPTTNFDQLANRNYHLRQQHMPEQEPVRAPIPAPPPAHDDALFPGHRRLIPENWVPEHDLTPGHRAARMEAREFEYQLHELDYKVYLRQCEIAREGRR